MAQIPGADAHPSPPDAAGRACLVGPVPFTVASPADAVIWILRAGAGVTAPATPTTATPGSAVFFWNAYNVALADDDPSYAALGRQAAAVFCDGVPVVWAGKRLHRDAPGWARVYGPDTMEAVLDAGRAAGLRHYLLGGSEETLAALERQIAVRWPGAQIAGRESPPFRPATSDELAARDQRIAASGAHLVWVGLGTPRQDVEALRLAAALPVLALGVGAAFDFLAGTKPQAPDVLQRAGLEWAYRLASEPRRLGRRYLWGNPRFVAVVVRQAASARRRTGGKA